MQFTKLSSGRKVRIDEQKREKIGPAEEGEKERAEGGAFPSLSRRTNSQEVHSLLFLHLPLLFGGRRRSLEPKQLDPGCTERKGGCCPPFLSSSTHNACSLLRKMWVNGMCNCRAQLSLHSLRFHCVRESPFPGWNRGRIPLAMHLG